MNEADQWFYDLDCYDDVKSIRFGVSDSGALFIDGKDKSIEKVLQVFKEMVVVSGELIGMVHYLIQYSRTGGYDDCTHPSPLWIDETT